MQGMGLLVFAAGLLALAGLAVARSRRAGLRSGLLVLIVPLLVIAEIAFYGLAVAVPVALLAAGALLAIHEADRRRRRAERDRERRAQRAAQWHRPYADAA
jgi:hypothetical protein